MTAKIRTYSEHFPWFIPDVNSSFRDVIIPSSRFYMNTEKPTIFKDYSQETPTDYNDSHRNYSSGTLAHSKVVVVARIGDYENETEGEWTIIAEPKERNETLNNIEKNSSTVSPENDDYFLGNDDVQKYLNDYQDLLYTFKDFVKIGADPSLRKNLSQNNVSNENHEKIFNVTYVMPIPKTKKYFEIRLSNLTKVQYNEINKLLQKHLLKKHNSTEMTSKEQETLYVDENTKGNDFVSHALSDPSSLSKTPKPALQNSGLPKDLTSKNEPISDYFSPLFTPEGFNYFLKNFDSIHLNLNNKSVDQTIFQPRNSPQTRIQNNGFHAEIPTDYVKRYDSNGENNVKEDTFNQTKNNSQDTPGSNNEQVGSGRSILNSNMRRNRTILFPQTRSKKPIIMNAPDNVLNTRKRKISPTTTVSISEQYMTTISPVLQQIPSTITLISHFDPIDISLNPAVNESVARTIFNMSQDIATNYDKKIPDNTSSLSGQDNNIVYNGSIDEMPRPLHIIEAAEWLIDMKRKIQEEEKKKTERYTNYFKQYLSGGDSSFLPGRESNGNIMKINKQDNILEELKWLMLDYFNSLNFKTQDTNSNNTSSAKHLILNATNIFELMEQASQMVKSNLKMKLQSETQEPTNLVRRIVEKQVERCNKIVYKEPVHGEEQNPPGVKKKSGHRRLSVFTRCMNFKLSRCIKGFSMWLERGKFFLRPQFKLSRAYENYEIERNLYCLRNYDPSSLGSNRHGVRVKPGQKVNSKQTGPRKYGARQNKQRLGMKANKLRNRQDGGKSAKPNKEKNRKVEQQQIPNEQLKVQRHFDKQVNPMRQQN